MSDEDKEDNNEIEIVGSEEVSVVSVRDGTDLVDPSTTKDEMLERDLDVIRQRSEEVAEVQERAIREVADLANSSQHPGAYESLATLAKSFNDTQRNLMKVVEIKKSLYDGNSGKKKVVEDEEFSKTTNIQNNNLYLTPSQLQDYLKNKKNE